MMELKDCPFCGGKAKIMLNEVSAGGIYARMTFSAGCSNCNAKLTNTYELQCTLNGLGEVVFVRDEREKVVLQWNKRK